MSRAKVECNLGFAGRQFLTRCEWETYCRRKPVRYIKRKHASNCENCGEIQTDQNQFQNAHRIGFGMGIVNLGLTPDFLDSHENIVTAHRTNCNRGVELSLEGAIKWLKSIGTQHLPSYLPDVIQDLWKSLE